MTLRRPVALDGLDRLSAAELSELVAANTVSALRLASAEELGRLADLAAALRADPRAAVRRLGDRVLRSVESGRAERNRVEALYAAEAAMSPADANLVAGVDEAGRGPLAGPVVAAAVILRPGVVIPGLDDSKRIPEEFREELYPEVLRAALHVGVGVLGPGSIERLNILQATYSVMRRALARLERQPDYVLIDGLGLPGLTLPHRGVIGGDAKCASIAAASIVAKVTRDRIMRRVALRFPAYGFERNKGYATRQHWDALDRHGLCPAHRPSFLGRSRQVELFSDDPDRAEDPVGKRG